MMTRVIKLPSFLKPTYETDLIRIGQKKDGGYLIPKKSLEHTKILYSFGLEADWSFEEDFYNRTKSKIYYIPNGASDIEITVSGVISCSYGYRKIYVNNYSYNFGEFRIPTSRFRYLNGELKKMIPTPLPEN